MLDVFDIAKPQNCDIQMFYGFADQVTSTDTNYMTWSKPRGVSHVYMLLIGGGGAGNGSSGGGSGAVTVWYGAAQNVPDSLSIYVRGPISQSYATTVSYRSSSGLVSLLTAQAANGATAGTSSAATAFAASGFYTSTAGQAGNIGIISASTTTFLSGGCANTITANYGYATTSTNNGRGYFQLQPIIVGVGANSTGTYFAAIGCGAQANGATGGPGFALIASW